MSLTPFHEWDYKMNERNVTSLINKIKGLLNELESEVRNHPEDYLPRKISYDEILMYEEYNDDDGYPD